MGAESKFQLHHTGIKTVSHVPQYANLILFQLHHTGIKTSAGTGRGRRALQFQLHHTGIKTLKRAIGTALLSRISIAPYRN